MRPKRTERCLAACAHPLPILESAQRAGPYAHDLIGRADPRVRQQGAGARASLQLVEHGLVQRAQVRGPLVDRAVLVHVQRAVVQLQQLVYLQG